ncbi:MAG: hypothetical protein ABI947_19325 [Chloroflexota bacterium]
MVQVFTSRLTRDDDKTNSQNTRINTTVQSGQQGRGSVLAPTWPLVAGHKLYEAMQSQNQIEIDRWKIDKVTGRPTTPLTDEAYTTQYLGLLRDRYARDKQPFLDLLQGEQVTLTCYCSPSTFCHRHIAVDVLEKVAAVHAMPFERGGEIDPHTGKLWLAPDNPARQQVQVGVVPVISPNGKTPVGFATAALVTQAQQRRLMEIGHFAPDEQTQAEKYADHLLVSLRQDKRVTIGRAEDIQETVKLLTDEARENGLSGLWKPLSPERNAAWEQGDHAINHTANQLRLPSDRQRVTLKLLPIISPDGRTRIGYAAAAFVSQQDNSAMLEVAHFNPKAKERAEDYTHELGQTLNKRGYLMSGHNRDVEKTVHWLTKQAQGNRLNGEWNAMPPEQRQHMNDDNFSLVHAYNELRTVSTTGLKAQDYER